MKHFEHGEEEWVSARPTVEVRIPARSSERPFTVRLRWAQAMLSASPVLPPPLWTFSVWGCMDPQGG